jgi:hypothetical protein
MARERSSYQGIPPFLQPLLEAALELPDLETLALLFDLKVASDAEKLVTRRNERLAGYKVRDIFCTKETKDLAKELLAILARYTVTKQGKEYVLTSTPTLDREVLERRLQQVRESERLAVQLGEDRVVEVRGLLTGATLEPLRFGTSPLIAVRTGSQEAAIKERYGEHVRVARLDTPAQASELLLKESVILILTDGVEAFGVEEPGIVPITSEALRDISTIHPEFVVNAFRAKQHALEVVLRLVTEFTELRDSPHFRDIAAAELERVLKLLRELEAGKRVGGFDFDEVLYRWEDALNREASRLVRTGGGADEFRSYLDEVVTNMAAELQLDSDDYRALKECAFENLERGPPFEFARRTIEILRRRCVRRQGERRYYAVRDCVRQLEQQRDVVKIALQRLVQLDVMLAIAEFTRDFGLTVPELVEGGLGVIAGRNPFLVDEARQGGEPVVPVSYSIGRTDSGLFGATPHPVAILTGANSGGKTCLLIMLASSLILMAYGLPVPAERAELPVVPLYLYRRKMIKKTGSFEYSMKALSRIFMRPGPKVVLIDELEALTEPGAMGRIMASVLNNLPKDTLAVMITHLIHELLPHINLKSVRVDGIESEGLDARGNILVDRQPRFNHIGSSTPELVIKKLLGHVRKEKLRTVYEEILGVLAQDRAEWQ